MFNAVSHWGNANRNHRHHLTPTRMAMPRRADGNSRAWRNWNPRTLLVGPRHRTAPSETIWSLPEGRNAEIHVTQQPHYSRVYIQESWKHVSIRTCKRTFTAALLMRPKNQKPRELDGNATAWTLRPWCWVKGGRGKRPRVVWFHLRETSRTGKSSYKTDSWMPRAGDRGWEESGKWLLRDTGILCGEMNRLWSWLWWQLHDSANIIKTTELYPVKGWTA